MDAKPTSADGVTPTQTLAAALIRQLGFDEAVCVCRSNLSFLFISSRSLTRTLMPSSAYFSMRWSHRSFPKRCANHFLCGPTMGCQGRERRRARNERFGASVAAFDAEAKAAADQAARRSYR